MKQEANKNRKQATKHYIIRPLTATTEQSNKTFTPSTHKWTFFLSILQKYWNSSFFPIQWIRWNHSHEEKASKIKKETKKTLTHTSKQGIKQKKKKKSRDYGIKNCMWKPLSVNFFTDKIKKMKAKNPFEHVTKRFWFLSRIFRPGKMQKYTQEQKKLKKSIQKNKKNKKRRKNQMNKQCNLNENL